MLPTLYEGDYIIACKVRNSLSKGDVVIFRDSRLGKRDIMKRVIATEGQAVKIGLISFIQVF